MLNRAANVSSTVGRQRSRTFDGDQTGGVAGVSKQIIGSGRARSQSWVEPTCGGYMISLYYRAIVVYGSMLALSVKCSGFDPC